MVKGRDQNKWQAFGGEGDDERKLLLSPSGSNLAVALATPGRNERDRDVHVIC